VSIPATTVYFPVEHHARPVGGLLFGGIVIILLGLGLGLVLDPALTVLAVVPPALLVLQWVWRQPARGLYLLIGATSVFEIFPLHFSDSLTDRVPFFLNLNNANSSAGLSGIPITPAEILMIGVIAIWFAAGVSKRSLRLERGPLVTAYLVFGLVVLGAEFHGMLGKGDWGKSLWELRPQAYGFITFLLAANLVVQRVQVRNLALLFFVAVAFKACIAAYRYFVTLHGNDAAYEAIMAHEESYFYALFILGTAVALIWGRGIPRAVMVVLLVFSALCFLDMIVNHRRASELALIAGGGTLMLLAIRFDDEHRGRWLALSLVTVAVFSAFTFVSWDHTSGLTGELVRPIRSLFIPDQRDYLSNIYRVAEDANLQVTYKTSPLFGIGFGIPMIVVFPMADISYIYPLWNYIPHNTVLWIGMRMGLLGYVVFFGLIAMAVMQACRQLATRKDPLLNGLAAFAVAAIVAEMIMGATDLQLDSFRNLIVLGALLGLLNRMPKLADA
jgi:hypothetical protein